MADMDKIYKVQMNAYELLKNFYVNSTDKVGKERQTLSHFESRLDLLKEYWTKFVDHHEQLITVAEANKDKIYFKEDYFSKAEDYFIHAKSRITDNIKHLSGASSTSQTDSAIANPTNNNTTSKLPPLKLPTFSGAQEDWESFKQRFNSMIRDKPNLSDVDKLQHLINALQGPAAQRVKGIEITAANYTVAWDKLVRRYDNKRIRLFNNLEKLIQLPSVRARNIQDLNNLVDKSEEALRALRDLGCPVDQWSCWLVHCIVRKLDHISREHWNISQEQTQDFSSYDDLAEFLERRIQSLEQSSVATLSGETRSGHNSPRVTDSVKRVSSHATHTNDHSASNRESSCVLCLSAHWLYACKKFKEMSVPQRLQFCKKQRLCLNCLQNSHFADKCPSTKRCLTCQGKHHTRLHAVNSTNKPSIQIDDSTDESKITEDQNNAQATSSFTTNSSVSTQATDAEKLILLATARVDLCDSFGKRISVRALIDPASESSFITTRAAQQLNLDSKRTLRSIVGMGGHETTKSRATTQLFVMSKHDNGFRLQFSALVLDELTRLLPKQPIKIKNWSHLHGLTLADPNYAKPDKVDCVLGADVYPIIIKEGLKKGPTGSPLAQHSVFGWLLTGKVLPNTHSLKESSVQVFNTFAEPDISDTLRKFWELEEVPRGHLLTPEEKLCEDQFIQTHERDETGRFVVRLPLSSTPSFVGSREIAQSRLLSSERRLRRDPALREAYKRFMQEYIDLKHMEPVPQTESNGNSYYLPHHAVFREGDNKIRVVFNASQRDASGHSLNDFLLPGYKLQADISAVITNWRFFRYVYTTDVVKMFRQIRVNPIDTDWQRILWRPDPAEPIQCYRATTVTYGTASAPYLALQVMKQLSLDGTHSHPSAATVLRQGLYVDDCYDGHDSIQGAIERRDQLISLLASAGMELGKWAANDPQILQGLTSTTSKEVNIKFDEVVSTLGVKWNRLTDSFTFSLNSKPSKPLITKRLILSEIARLFDPLGWLAPLIVVAKTLLQELWLHNLEWDTLLTDSLEKKWATFRLGLEHLENITISRWTGIERSQPWTLHGFADASKQAYAAAIYAVLPGHSAVLLMAKSKVAPIKLQTVPRLELCGSLLLVRLAKHLLDHLQVQPNKVFFWTDSRIVLEWLKGHPSRWPTFIANRTSEIITSFPQATWRHVRTSHNPADCATRGLTASQLAAHAIWWHGPPWITQEESQWPENGLTADPIQALSTEEVKAQNCKKQDLTECLPLFQQKSSYLKILRILALIAHWLRAARNPNQNRQDKGLKVDDFVKARIFCFRAVQLAHFSEDRRRLESGRQLPKQSCLRRLRPFVCDNGLIRLGGRLQHSTLPDDEKHPIILPGNCALVTRLVEDVHRLTLHGGPQLMLSVLRGTWLIGGHRIAYKIYRRCATCTRYNANVAQQQMGQLPAVRLTPARPFSTSGLDYAGPIPILFSKARGSRTTKGFVAIFVCTVSRAVHLEIVSDLTAEAFLAAFSRFCARRAVCYSLTSDNATTFVGAAAELRRMFNESSDFYKAVSSSLSPQGVQWTFIPPRAPHFGGLWESAVKSFKHHFRRVLGDATLTYEELSTLAAKIEACLNSRPLCSMSSDADASPALTPAHFLVGSTLLSYPERYEEAATSRKLVSRWRQLSLMRDSFWSRWKKEVLHGMQLSNKWHKRQPNLQRGHVVLIKDEITPPTRWPLGIITEVHPGADGLVRVATVKTANSLFKRPIVKLIKLHTEPELMACYEQTKL